MRANHAGGNALAGHAEEEVANEVEEATDEAKDTSA